MKNIDKIIQSQEFNVFQPDALLEKGNYIIYYYNIQYEMALQKLMTDDDLQSYDLDIQQQGYNNNQKQINNIKEVFYEILGFLNDYFQRFIFVRTQSLVCQIKKDQMLNDLENKNLLNKQID
ncbi:hypothetical protein PPERSA_10903 [Pseudocohnilembus persalinus]|uniref:Uncharacterized protein n=1 Tax=Pseudocohnilembus persalinus TaxID=266149 RepID=A0A0V0R9R7_PSEPJ|nr:hypothetical protein PPERSA_10903 [Pseudocohnilembus persalinus]|eukprot:KRX11136.1 hypothetical protein PPERSA_10903 [Pseudocohnilembus persalinus]